MLLGEFCVTALKRSDIFYTVDKARHWGLEQTWLLLFAQLYWFLSSLVVCYWILLREQLASPDLQVHLEVFFYLGQNMFSSGGSPAVLSALKEILILVAGRVVLQTEMDLCRSVPGSFSFLTSSLPCGFCSAQCWVSRLQTSPKFLQPIFLFFSRCFHLFP